MATTSVVGGSPIFVLTNAGLEVGVPLGALSVTDGAIDTSRLDPAIADSVGKMASLLLANRVITAGAVPAAVPALKLTATVTGTAGNGIEVTLADVDADEDHPGKTTADVTIVAGDRREGLTPASVGDALGTPTGGTSPGLVALAGPAAKLPAALAATPLAAPNPGAPPELTLAAEDGSGDAFTLVAIAADDLFADVSVAVEDVDTAAGTFTLLITLDHTATDIALEDLDAALAPLVDVAPGPGGFAVPAAGTWTLAGGVAPQTAAGKPAGVSVPSA